MEIEELKAKLRACGVVGAGGAGFPTYAKLNSLADVVILNSSECEPLLRVDRQLSKYYVEQILTALELIVKTLKAEKGIYAIKSEYTQAITSLKAVIYKYENIEIKILDNVYPAGDEVVLVYEATGKIVPQGSLPIEVGAVVLNTETVLNVYNCVFLDKPLTEKYVTITGEVNNPTTLKVPIGTSIGQCIELAGGVKIKNFRLILGGPMTGRLGEIEDVITKTSKAIIVLPEEHSIILRRLTRSAIKINRAMSVCSQCRMCTDLCPRYLLGHSIQPHRIMNAIANGLTSDVEAFKSAALCCGCGICENYACYQGLAPSSIIGELKVRLKEKGVNNTPPKQASKVNIMRNGRKVPMKRLIARLGLTKYNISAPLIDELCNVLKVDIKLSQHIGAPATPMVKVGDLVRVGDLIGEIEEGKLGANIHSSINGVVTNVNNDVITIEARGDMNG
ncbi:4Fe-4S dicluster domain-containing protein [Clostridium lacusfryxellense]|uniref:4Fe-4S dicluster domain-containing protein n=1 Tax=Clostridium lacusfryxellense TaxID=205328 RepID=UPI001C0CFFF3|nr:4Fe-4S dicluster domain-containing protein [Clostridium lacusfryxellense]MBU3112753.1 SLBB domain-containing protein [Clostridium lacusfryxellense]